MKARENVWISAFRIPRLGPRRSSVYMRTEAVSRSDSKRFDKYLGGHLPPRPESGASRAEHAAQPSKPTMLFHVKRRTSCTETQCKASRQARRFHTSSCCRWLHPPLMGKPRARGSYVLNVRRLPILTRRVIQRRPDPSRYDIEGKPFAFPWHQSKPLAWAQTG